ncbi:glycoside hydrolase family protein [Defluviitalea phaphyphila]|uniref:hypothetical protein n=1 Tax=Defluviitalea phaphyphila TaxID=1473580 RepID=UPI0007316635|nr:hypothetical protein [Defluviitalea phaphyphila]
MKDDYIFILTDDTGMLQHSKCGIPDPTYGYTTDDNARALIMAVMLYERFKEKKYLDLIYRYSSFILNAQTNSGKFRNFMSYSRKWLEEEGSEDCFGRCLWALGFSYSNKSTPKGIKLSLSYILKKAFPNVTSLCYSRGKAYSILGLSYINSQEAKNIIFKLATDICNQYDKYKDNKWKWFENDITYSNSVLPWALFVAYRILEENRFLHVAEESLKFLETIIFRYGFFKPIGCKGWLKKGGEPAEFDEQPVEACEMTLTYLEAYSITGNKRYKDMAQKCYDWYEGMNSKGIRLVDSFTGGCFDGLTEEGVNLNIGAESVISYYISYLSMLKINSLI